MDGSSRVYAALNEIFSSRAAWSWANCSICMTASFVAVDPKATGHPAHHPVVPLQLFICGYLNHIG